MTVSVHHQGGGQVPEALCKKLITAARFLLNEHHLAQGDVAIVLADNDMLRELNRRYRSIDCPTDVLSFPMLEPPDLERNAAGDLEELMVGDIYISMERAREQARTAGHCWEREVLILAVHGLLHLLGYDHGGTAAAVIMQQKEVEIINLVDCGVDGKSDQWNV